VSVTVVGVKFDWLKIAPPEGSYCYVAKAYVEKRGNGDVGRVTSPLNVRVGSSLNAMKTKVASRLEAGADVQILGEQDEYFKIAPPKEVYLYVNKQFVDLVQVVKDKPAVPANPVTPDNKTPEPPVIAQNPPTNPQTPENNGGAGGTIETQAQAPIAPPIIAEKPTTNPTGDNPEVATNTNTNTGNSAGPATQPLTQVDAETQFDNLERTFIENDRKTIDQQPLAEMQAGYEKLVQNPTLPESLRRMCDYRIATLKQRNEDKDRVVALRKSQEELAAKTKALQVEQEELTNRIKLSGVKYFAAVGTLRVSSLQQGLGGTLYRLTDPKSGRTVIYIRSDDAKLAAQLNQFIGVKGNVQDETNLNLKSITPTEFETVDQSKVNITISAQIVPPSMMPSGIANTGNE
jgi:hypothetical protein